MWWTREQDTDAKRWTILRMGSVGHEVKMDGSVSGWQSKVSAKQQQCKDAIPKDWMLSPEMLELVTFPLDKNPNKLIDLEVVKKSGILTDQELSITEDYSVSQLLAKLASGELTSVAVTTAFSKRAAIAQQLTSCLTETFFDEALERAKVLRSDQK